MGTHSPRLPCDSRLRLRRHGYSLIPQRFLLCAALWLEEVSPVIHHRLKKLVREQSNCGWWARTTVIAFQQSFTEVSAIYATDRMLEDITIHAG